MKFIESPHLLISTFYRKFSQHLIYVNDGIFCAYVPDSMVWGKYGGDIVVVSPKAGESNDYRALKTNS